VIRGFIGDDIMPGCSFTPVDVESFLFTLVSRSVPVQGHSHVCFDCGLLWSEVDQESLQRTIETWGTFFLKDTLGLTESKKHTPDADELA